MTIAEQVKNALQEEYRNGGKQQEMAAKHGVSQQYISRLLSGKRSCEGLSLKAVNNMFPYATLNINGNLTADNSGINHGVVGINNGTVNSTSVNGDVEKFRVKALSAIIDLDIPSDTLQIVLKTLKNLKL